jgi:hypothetical protein
MAAAEVADVTAQISEKSQPTQVLPTDRIALPKQIDLLRVYALVSGPSKKVVTTADAESIMKLKASTLALASPFFVNAGLLLRSDKGFIPSDAVTNFQRAWQWKADTATHKLAPVISMTWFAQRLLPKLTYRATMPEDEAINELADACHATPDYGPRLGLLLDYMSVAGLIKREGGMITLLQSAPMSGPDTASPEPTPEVDVAPQPPKSTVTTSFSQQPAEGTVQFHVSVSVDMAEFSSWKPDRIAAFFSGMAAVLAAKAGIEKENHK